MLHYIYNTKEAPMGGNIFKDRATSIEAQNIQPTIQAYREFLSSVFPQKAEAFNFFEPVGSAGKKPVSGDLDLAIDSSHIVESFTGDELAKWSVNYDDWNDLYTKIHKRARTATYEMSKMRALLTLISEKMSAAGMDIGPRVTAGNIFSCFPQHGPDGTTTGDSVQIDWMVGDIDWLRWSYFSCSDTNLKGLHRTQFIVACLSAKNYTFNHFSGIKEKGTSDWTIDAPKDAVKLLSDLYGELDISQTYKFKDLHLWLHNTTSPAEYREVIIRYRGILELAKAHIPEVITAQA